MTAAVPQDEIPTVDGYRSEKSYVEAFRSEGAKECNNIALLSVVRFRAEHQIERTQPYHQA
jgi:hypothetical protein